jgi:hypothetical protein
MQLEILQSDMIAAIDEGPDRLADSAYLGSRTAALRGFAVHANTISHARLVALEDSFPLCREHFGHGQFNALSRLFIELAEAMSAPLATIGRQFPAFLAESGHDEGAALACFEWAWLEAYHAAEGKALRMAELAGLGEDALLRTPVARHPAARLVGPVPDEALTQDVPGLAGAAAILITRPRAEVLVSPANEAMVRQFELLATPQPFCDLIGDGNDSLQAFYAMIGTGSLILA